MALGDQPYVRSHAYEPDGRWYILVEWTQEPAAMLVACWPVDTRTRTLDIVAWNPVRDHWERVELDRSIDQLPHTLADALNIPKEL